MDPHHITGFGLRRLARTVVTSSERRIGLSSTAVAGCGKSIDVALRPNISLVQSMSCGAFASTMPVSMSWLGVTALEASTSSLFLVSSMSSHHCRVTRRGAKKAARFALLLDCIDAGEARHTHCARRRSFRGSRATMCSSISGGMLEMRHVGGAAATSRRSAC